MGLSRSIIAFLVVVCTAFPAWADSLDGYPLLRESYDPGLQEGLERSLKALGLSKAVAKGRLAVSLVDITDLEDPRLAYVNGDQMMYAASLPKIAILLGAFVEIERGRFPLDDATRKSLTEMIRFSSNREATRMLNKVGKNRLLEILQSDRFALYDPAVNGGLWVGKEYGKSPAYKRDPLHNTSHGATVLQTARFYYLLETGQLVSPKLTRIMKAMLSKPGIKHKFVRGLSDQPGVKIYRKSGSWSRFHSDSAIVESGDRKYIVVALAESKDGGNWLARLVKPLHQLVVPTNTASASQ